MAAGLLVKMGSEIMRPFLGWLFLLVKCKLFKKFEFSRRSGWVPFSGSSLDPRMWT